LLLLFFFFFLVVWKIYVLTNNLKKKKNYAKKINNVMNVHFLKFDFCLVSLLNKQKNFFFFVFDTEKKNLPKKTKVKIKKKNNFIITRKDCF
jgi:hypothetical protein